MPDNSIKPRLEGTTVWLPLPVVAREFQKTRQTLWVWCRSGFILTLGYRAKQDEKGHWFLAKL